MARDDSIRLRRATIADAEPLALSVIEGVEDYPSFAAPGWTPPSFEAELKHQREALADRDVFCLIAESEGALVGQITVLPAAHAPHPVEDSSLAHISNLFVRRDHWGVGVAAQLHRAAVDAAGARGFTGLRLFVAAGQARARRFYEREGWLPAGDPFDDPIPGLTMIELPLQTPRPMSDAPTRASVNRRARGAPPHSTGACSPLDGGPSHNPGLFSTGDRARGSWTAKSELGGRNMVTL